MKNAYVMALLEDINGKFDFVIEVIVPDIEEIKQDVRVLKAEVTDIKTNLNSVNAWVRDHETRIKQLEAA